MNGGEGVTPIYAACSKFMQSNWTKEKEYSKIFMFVLLKDMNMA